MQTKLQSFMEANSNTFAGMLISYAASFLIYPALGMGGTATTYVVATTFFTLLSIVRNYLVRRFFNWRHQ